MTIDKHGSDIRTSIHGRRFGLDGDDFLTGHSGVREPYESSTAASTLTAYGLSVLSGSTASHTLGAPPAIGVTKTIVNASSLSTAAMTVTRATSSISFLGSTGGDPAGAAFSLINAGSAVTLIGISASQWAMTASKASSLYMTISTSS